MSKLWHWCIKHHINIVFGLLFTASVGLLANSQLRDAPVADDQVRHRLTSLAGAKTGDMIVVSNKNRTKACVLVVVRQDDRNISNWAMCRYDQRSDLV